MRFSAQKLAALAVVLLSAHSIASGVKAAPVPKSDLEHVAHGAHIASDATEAYGAVKNANQRREPGPIKIAGILKGVENVLKREPKPEPISLERRGKGFQVYNGQYVSAGTVLVTGGSRYSSGVGVGRGRDGTLHALTSGVVHISGTIISVT